MSRKNRNRSKKNRKFQKSKRATWNHTIANLLKASIKELFKDIIKEVIKFLFLLLLSYLLMLI